MKYLLAEVLLWPPKGLLSPGKGWRISVHGLRCHGRQGVLINKRSWWRGLWLSGISLYIWELESLALLLFWAGFPKSPGGRGSPGWPPGLLGVLLLFLMAASASCRIIKVPDHPEALCFQIRGAAPPYVYAVGRGEWEPNRQRVELWTHTGSVCVRSLEPPKPLPQDCACTVNTYFLCLKP